MLVSGSELLAQAARSGRAVGSFNTYNLEITAAILRAAEAQNAPVFLALGKGALDYAGFELLSRASIIAAEQASVPVAVHLDHSPSIDLVVRAVEAGYSSVMIDGSSQPFDSNIDLTKRAVASAQPVTVEAELGAVAGSEDRSEAHSSQIPMTGPAQAAEFVDATGIHSLAIKLSYWFG